MDNKQQPPYPLRMPQDMRSHLEDVAKAEGRSLNAEIVAQLSEVQLLRNRCESLQNELVETRESLNRMWQQRAVSEQKDREQRVADIGQINSYIEAARLHQLRHRDLSILFNMFFSVVKSAVDDGRIAAEALSHSSAIFELIEQVLDEGDGRAAPAEAISDFLRGVEKPLVAAAMRTAFDWIEQALALLEQARPEPSARARKRGSAIKS